MADSGASRPLGKTPSLPTAYSDKVLGQVAYEEYCESLYAFPVRGPRLKRWDELDSFMQGHWVRAARATRIYLQGAF